MDLFAFLGEGGVKVPIKGKLCSNYNFLLIGLKVFSFLMSLPAVSLVATDNTETVDRMGRGEVRMSHP